MSKLLYLSLPLALAVGCTDTEDPPPVDPPDPPPRITCGAGTRQEGSECIVDNRRHFELRIKSKDVSADRLQLVPILALGTNADGSLVHEPAVLRIDRPNAGLFPQQVVELGEMGALTHYRPCSSTQAGCLGPARLSMALLSEPNTPVATLDVNLVEAPGGSSAAACETADSIMFFDGEDEIYTGTLAVTDAAWGVDGTPDRLKLRVEPNMTTGNQARRWELEFSTTELGIPMTPGVYDDARRPNPGNGGGNGMGNPHAGLDIRSINGHCTGNMSSGRFEVHSYEVADNVVTGALISFEQRCQGAARTLRGCIRVGAPQ
jgi:hypothetical protein